MSKTKKKTKNEMILKFTQNNLLDMKGNSNSILEQTNVHGNKDENYE